MFGHSLRSFHWVMPGPGKSFAAFQADNTACRAFSADQVKGQAEAANRNSIGTGLLSTLGGAGIGASLGAVAGTVLGSSSNSADQANIQQQYDTAYAQCMYSKGDQVPGYGRGYAATGAAPDPTIRATQAELNRLGYLKEPADGFAGGHTRSAIASFEQANGMPVDGVASSRLLARLQSTTTASAAPSGWVAPTDSPAPSHQAAAASAGWVSPASTATTPASTAATTPSGWVSPAKP